jgi:uncharacterized SAM-binding protein YcdF (DUF218 family)
MGYALKQMIEWCISPLGLALLLLGAGVVAGFTRGRGIGRGLAAAGFMTLFVFSLPPVASELSRSLSLRFPPLAASAPLDGVVAVAVLGAGYEREPGRPATHWLAPAGLGRLVEGVRVLRLAPGSRMVVSGRGSPDGPSTAEVMEEAAVMLGVEPTRIVRFDAPRDTAEEIAALRALVGRQKTVIVTSAEHMPRAMALATHAGLAAIAAPASVAPGLAGEGAWSWVPSVTALEHSTAAVHELLGLTWAKLVGLI